eukprot:scaffold3987_cov143-Skeletonema_marinoi.AAC.3
MSTKRKHNQLSRFDGDRSTTIVPPVPLPSKSPATSRQSPLPLPTSSAPLSLASNIEDGGRSSSYHRRTTLSRHTHQQQAISSTENALRAVEPLPATVPLPVTEFSASEQHQRLKKRGRKNATVDNSGIGNQGNFYTHDGIGNEVGGIGNQSGATISSLHQPHSAPETWTPGAQKAERKVFNSSNVNVKGGIRHVHIVDRAKSQRRLYKAMQIKKRIKANPQKESHFNKCYGLAIQTSAQFRQQRVSNEGVAFRAMSNENKKNGGVYGWIRADGTRTIGQTKCYDTRGKRRFKEEKEKAQGAGKELSGDINEMMSIVAYTDECVTIMSGDELLPILETATEMKCPRLHFHPDWDNERTEKISRLFIESAVASLVEGYYNEHVLECLLEMPSQDIESIVSTPIINSKCSNVKRRCDTFLPVFTWGPLKSFLVECQLSDNPSLPPDLQSHVTDDQRNFLRAVMNPLHRHQFLQHNQYVETIGCQNVTVMPFVNLVESKDNPRTILLVQVVNELKDLFTPSIINEFIQSGQIPLDIRSRAKAIVSRIKGNDYQEPDKKVLNAAYNRGLRALNKEHSGRQNVMITLEHTVYESLSEETRAILFPEESDFQYQYTVDGVKAEFTIETPYGPHYTVMAPSHVVFGEKKSEAHRIMAIKRTVASMAVNNDAGKLSDADFESKIGIFRCFLMQWFGFGGSQDKRLGDFYAARKYAIGKNLCSPHFGRAGTQMTAKRVGKDVKQPDVIFLRTFLGMNLFNALLTCCDKPTSRANPSPLDDPLQREKWEQERQQERQQEYYQRNREARLAYREMNGERIREQQRVYYEMNGERIREQQRVYYEMNGERIREQRRENYQMNGERIREQRRVYRVMNGERMREQERVYREMNGERMREQDRVYYHNNRDRINERVQQRRESEKEKKARAEAERIIKKAEVALTRYMKLKETETLQYVTKDDMKSLLAFIVPLYPVDEHDKTIKNATVDKMRERLGLPQSGGLKEGTCLSTYFPTGWKEDWRARILE